MEPQHPLAKAYASRVARVNDTVADALQPTRQWLAILEILDLAWLILLVVSVKLGLLARSTAA